MSQLYNFEKIDDTDVFVVTIKCKKWYYIKDMFKSQGIPDYEMVRVKDLNLGMKTINNLLKEIGKKFEELPKIDGLANKSKFIPEEKIEHAKEKMKNRKMRSNKWRERFMVEAKENKEVVCVNKTDTHLDNILTYDGFPVTYFCIGTEVWFKGIEVARLLGYHEPKQTIQKNIKNEWKKSYKELFNSKDSQTTILSKSEVQNRGVKKYTPLKSDIRYNIKETIDPQTMFINTNALYKLIFKSSKPEAEKFTDYVTSVLESIRLTGSYSINNTLTFESFYTDNTISKFEGKSVIYFGYIGCHAGEHLIKFGNSSSVYKRDLLQHRKNFDTFELLLIAECHNKEDIEEKFKKEIRGRKLNRSLIINSHKYIELFSVNDKDQYQQMVDLLNHLVSEYQHPVLIEKNSEIESIKFNYEKLLLEERLAHSYKENELLKETNAKLELIINKLMDKNG